MAQIIGIERKLNWRPARPDFRDFRYQHHVEAVETAEAVKYPAQSDIRNVMSSVMDQKSVGSCSANALAACVEHLELLELKANMPAAQAPQVYAAGQFFTVSRLMAYWNERFLEGSTDSDAGAATLKDGCRALHKWGVSEESLWPYDESMVLVKPSAAAFAQGAQHKIAAYYALSTIQDMKRCLYHGYPFVFGFSVYSSFMSDAVARTGICPMPSWNDRMEGGHAVTCVGYDDMRQMALVRNSWGTGWGIQGHFWMPYQYLFNPSLASDMWTLRRTVTGSAAPQQIAA